MRLPSPADLARTAALVCRRWRRVASGPAFLRRFRRLHPPQLLGFFICNGGHPYRDAFLDRMEGRVLDRSPLPVLDPTFLPVVPLDPAVARCRDFSLSSLPSVDHWSLADSRDGLLLLCSSSDRADRRGIPKHFAVCDPLSGRSVLLPARDATQYIGSTFLGAALVISDKDEGDTFSFEVLIATYYFEGPGLCDFSSSKREWAVVPCPDTEKLYDYKHPWIGEGVRASGCVYWVVHDSGWELEHILVLNSQTKKLSTINLPCRGMCEKYDRNIKVLRSEADSDLRVVALARSSCALHFWRRDRSRSPKGRWVKEEVVTFAGVGGVLDLLVESGGIYVECDYGFALRIIDAGEGFVFFKESHGVCSKSQRNDPAQTAK